MGIRLIRRHVHSFLPGIDRFFGMAEPGCEQAVIDERVRIARKNIEHAAVVLVGFGVTAVFDHRAPGGVLEAGIIGIDCDGACERGDSLVFLSSFVEAFAMRA